MNFSKKTRYALCALTELALAATDAPVRASTIASRHKIPEAYLDQLLLFFKRTWLLRSIRWMQGGFVLSRAPREISLFDVLLAMEGPIVCEPSQPTAKRTSDVE